MHRYIKYSPINNALDQPLSRNLQQRYHLRHSFEGFHFNYEMRNDSFFIISLLGFYSEEWVYIFFQLSSSKQILTSNLPLPKSFQRYLFQS